ncbi:MAG: copper resistance protein NlpE N-terminal domain-containing protein [Elusimicrobiota bacterium]|jgi:uncharacterized lipoprotein NlpE involved in copper resistance|nr:copper resistance protein NlpE N-terminal domain-containing protein [Elusimicrobiota bacterium]
MKKIVYMAGAVVFMFALGACVSRNCVVTHDEGYVDIVRTSRNSVDWDGTYAGIIPCADCNGIKVEITLNLEGTYKISYTYLGKIGHIILDTKEFPPYYIVGAGKLIQLDMNGQEITGELAGKYVLIKNN